jgi:hypothetical protein
LEYNYDVTGIPNLSPNHVPQTPVSLVGAITAAALPQLQICQGTSLPDK